MSVLFLCFIVVPIVEMYILIQVGGLIGGLYTIGLVLLTALIGVTLLKRQGLSTLMTAQQKMQTGQMPVTEMAEGLMLAVAGALLLTPGFVTDAVGFILLTPYLRQYLAERLFKVWLKNNVQTQFYSQTTYYSRTDRDAGNGSFERGRAYNKDAEDVIEGEYQTVSEEKIEKK